MFTVLSRERLASSRDKTIFGRVWFLSQLTDVGEWGKLRSFDLQQAATLSAGLCTLPERQTAVWITIKMQSSFTSGTDGFALPAVGGRFGVS